MNINEVISQLQKIKEVIGDREVIVRIRTNGTEHGIREIELLQAKWDSPVLYPERVLIGLKP